MKWYTKTMEHIMMDAADRKEFINICLGAASMAASLLAATWMIFSQ
jgi:hypothetical protein